MTLLELGVKLTVDGSPMFDEEVTMEDSVCLRDACIAAINKLCAECKKVMDSCL